MRESPASLLFLSGNDAITLLETIHQSISCSTEKDFIDLFPKIQQLFPFDFAGALMGNYDDGKGLAISHGVNISFPEEWVREYVSKNYHLTSAVAKRNFTTYELQYMSDTWGKSRHQEEIISLCVDFGIKEAYFHGSRPVAPWKNGSLFSFASPSMKRDRRTVAILEFLTPHLHLAFSHIFDNKQSNIDNTVLSPREKEVLNWLKRGKSSWDISVILGISESTVNYHVYNIMRKLDALNRPQAVAIATRLGLIDVD